LVHRLQGMRMQDHVDVYTPGIGMRELKCPTCLTESTYSSDDFKTAQVGPLTTYPSSH